MTHDSISLDGGSDLLGAGRYVEDGLGLEAVLEGFFGDGGAAPHVLVGGIRARPDETGAYVDGPGVLLRRISQLEDAFEDFKLERARFEMREVRATEIYSCKK